MSPRCAWWVLAAGFVVGVLVGSGTAAAQATTLFQVQVKGASEDGDQDFVIRKSLGETTFTFTISFLCSSGTQYGSCSDNTQELEVTLTPTQSSYPGGWSVAGATEEKFRMRAQEEKAIPVKVKLLTDDPEEDRFKIGLRAEARPVTPSQIPTLPPQLGQASNAADEVQVEKILTVAEEITSLARTYMWPLLGAAVVLIVAGVVLVERKRGGGLTVVAETPTQDVLPGRSASFALTAENQSRDPDRVQIQTSSLPTGWDAILPLQELDLRAGERTQFWLTLRAPPDASPGSAFGFDVRTRSATNARHDAAVRLTVRVADTESAWRRAESVSAPGPLELEAEAVAEPEPAEPIRLEDEEATLADEAPKRPPRKRVGRRRKR